MAYTQEELDAIKKAFASGVTTVKYQDKQVTYRSLAEMKEIIAAMEAEVNAATPGIRHVRVNSSKGW